MPKVLSEIKTISGYNLKEQIKNLKYNMNTKIELSLYAKSPT